MDDLILVFNYNSGDGRRGKTLHNILFYVIYIRYYTDKFSFKAIRLINLGFNTPIPEPLKFFNINMI